DHMLAGVGGIHTHLRMQPARRADANDIDILALKQIAVVLVGLDAILPRKALGTRPDHIRDGDEARPRQLADRLRMAGRNPATADQAKCYKISLCHTATSFFN